MHFKIKSDFSPTGDQPQAIQQLCEGISSGAKYQTLLGVTGSGKTAAFALPFLERLLYRPKDNAAIRVLVVTPTG